MLSLCFYLFMRWNYSKVPSCYRKKADPILANALFVIDLVVVGALTGFL